MHILLPGRFLNKSELLLTMVRKARLMYFSQIEILHLLIAWVVISFAFAIMYSGGNLMTPVFFDRLWISAATVGLGFLLHELAHKYVAQQYGRWAEFRADFFMLILALIMSFMGVVFAAPGAVYIRGQVTKEQNGKISIAGPLTNFGLAVIFLILFLALPQYKQPCAYGLIINTWLCIFNLIPIWNFDGKKILDWNKLYYGLLLAGGIILMVASFGIAGSLL